MTRAGALLRQHWTGFPLLLYVFAITLLFAVNAKAPAADATKPVSKAVAKPVSKPVSKAAAKTVAKSITATIPGGAGIRKLSFPKERSIGTLLLLPPTKTITTAYQQISGAKGDVEVDVPNDNLLIFEPNQQVFLHPELLDKVSVGAVDALKISFLAMEPKEDKLCEAVLKHLSRFSNISILSLSDSDATDSGVVAALHFPHLKELITTHTYVTGHFLKNADLKLVTFMDIGDCPIEADSYKYLHALKSLTGLCLSKNSLDASKLVDVAAACPNLTTLDINGNPKIDDSCVKVLLRFKKLQSLNLIGTSVTFQGIKMLAALKLKKVLLPRSDYNESEKAFLTKSFGLAIIKSDIKSLRQRDIEKILAPTVRMKSTR